MQTTSQPLTLIAPQCQCCTTPAMLLPRDDLGAGMAACPATGQLYRPDGAQYVPSAPPPLTSSQPAPRVQIDLNHAGYA